MLFNPPVAVTGIGLKIESLAFRYHSHGPDVLSDLSVSIAPGSFVAIVGRSGIGKSTLLNLVLGYLRPTAGTIIFDGEQVGGPSLSRIPIYQEDALWPWLRVWENIALTSFLHGGRRAARRHKPAVYSLLDQVGLDRKLAEKFPRYLSVGMRKRVEIARALFACPKILVADEPFSGLDEVTKLGIYDFMIDVWNEGRFSVLFSTHDVREALRLADRILVMQGNTAATIACDFLNPLPRNRSVQREANSEYSVLYDRVVAAMR
jgi:NitT/TauT family transport system ATP-binding protein